MAVVGEDFTPEQKMSSENEKLTREASNMSKGKTFRWGGQYLDNLNEAKTDFTELNVFENFEPRIPPRIHGFEIPVSGEYPPHPAGAAFGREMNGVALTGGDTMNFWINGTRPQLTADAETCQRAS